MRVRFEGVTSRFQMRTRPIVIDRVPAERPGGVTITVNGLAGEIDWRQTEVGLVAGPGLKIILSEVVAESVAERPRTLETALLQTLSVEAVVNARSPRSGHRLME